MIARRIKVHGHVQGVGFRYAMVGTAEACGVTGWVRNRLDGTVEVYVEGEADAVQRAIAWCRHGPRSARVTAVDVTEEPVTDACVDFSARPTA